MLPPQIPHYSVGPFIGLVANAVMSILCLAIMALYSHYRPLRSLLLFYLLSTCLFLGWVIYGFQGSPRTILLGYRIDLAALALLPASWSWFTASLYGQRLGRLPKGLVVAGSLLALLALFGKGPWFLGLPLEPHDMATDILRPQSKLLRPLIHLFALSAGVFYCLAFVKKFLRREGPGYLYPFATGMILWLIGGGHDALRSSGLATLFDGQILWFTSLWLSIFLSLSVALHFRSLERAVRETKDVFEKFVPPAYLRRIATAGLGSVRLGEADQQTAAILCCDIRGFTALSERLSPVRLIHLVNQLYEEIALIVKGRAGVIDKFLGDAVLCLFEGLEAARRAVDCGMEILSSVKGFNRAHAISKEDEIQIGIGLHFGPVILGTIGSKDRMDSTVLGLTVNLAKRLEELTKSMGVAMLLSEEVASQLPGGYSARLRDFGEVRVKGSSFPIRVYGVDAED
ncbi:MAG: adenylate/guanylate cyclase domain-containing protein [Desulfobacterota bacterium]|nr:adenylate/guanylate cyclase domain-containing protein [Thermodesulfobacteriota bacterium]